MRVLALVQASFARQLTHPARLGRGLRALGAIALAYALCMFVLAAGGAAPGPAPWITIPVETYFFWEGFFIGPVIFAGGLLAAATMHLLARSQRMDGSFDDAMALVGVAIAWCTLTTVVPDFVIGALLCAKAVSAEAWMHAIKTPSLVLAVVWVYLLIYLAAFLTTFPMIARLVYGLGRGAALAIGWASFAVYQAFLYVFVR